MSLRTTLVLLMGLVFVGCSSTQQAAQMSGPAADTASEKKSIEDATKSSEEIGGLFTIYRDTTKGTLQMKIRADQLDKDYIYFAYTMDGIVPAGHFRGAFRDNAVFTIRKRYDKIEFVEENTSFYFDDDSALSRASGANISPSVLAVKEIAAEDTTDGGTYLVDADDLFITEAMHQVKPSPRPDQPPTAFSLGNLSKEKTAVLDVRNYPKNTDVIVRYVYENPSPLNGGSDAVTDARNVSVTLQHSLIEVPENDYEPLFADPRVGYFTTQVDDQTSTSATPYRDLVHRWHLKKKDPNAEMSEPVEPIVWWIENTTPEEIRPAVEAAVLEWNKAFEAAGFRNAIQVKVQPDTASWDAGDIRYNVLRWTSSPNPPVGGYGPSFVNPRTGQILGADIMLEYVFLTNRMNYSELFDAAALLTMSVDEIMTHDTHGGTCTLGSFMHMNTLFGVHALKAMEASTIEVNKLVENGIYYLMLHEVGHTIGLNHNMRASQMLAPEEVNDESLTQEKGLIGSIMDYPAINVANDRSQQGQYYSATPGPYDVWAVRFAYEDMSDGERADLLNRSTEPDLAFGNDADDMRAPGKAINPHVNVGDMSSDAVGYARNRFELVRNVMEDLRMKYREPGQSYQELRNAYLTLTGQYAQMAAVVSRYPGGVYFDRGFIGQEGSEQPYTPVPLEQQKEAMDILATYVFAPDAFDAPNDLYNYLQPQRRGFNFFGETEDPKIHARALAIQGSVLAHLVHPTVLERMTDTRLYGNEYVLADYMTDLTNAVFEADARGNVNTFRQNLQLAYVNGLANVLSEEGRKQYDYVAQSAALGSLNQIERMIRAKRGVNTETRAHTDHLLFLINKAKDTD